MIGTVILDRYRIEKLLGEGGFGAVYQAEDTKFERAVALKILSKVAQQNPEHTRRFIDEAKVTSKLSHRNIPIVYDYGESEDGMLFIVTELFVGGSLEELINSTFFSPRQASWITSEVNEALVVAHQQGITHRDVKPPNIYVHRGSSGEEVKLLDFGIAKLSNHESHTLTGQLFGTPYFMSPEQILGRRDITPAADLYSLGAVLFYNLTSTVPFDGESQFVIFNKHVNAPVPLIVDRVPSLNSPRLQQLLELLMDKNPRQRPQSAYEAREIFAEVEHITQRLDQRERQPLLQQWEYHTEREVAPTEAVAPVGSLNVFEAIETPIEFSQSLPSAFELSSDELSLESLDEFSLSEEITVSPLVSSSDAREVPGPFPAHHEEWRPTARLELKEIDDALAGEDDTTDNVVTKRSPSGSLPSPTVSYSDEVTSPRFSTPPIAQSAPSISAPPLNLKSPSNPIFGGASPSEEVTRFYNDERLSSPQPPTTSPLTRIWVAVGVFCVGLILSLAWFNDQPSDGGDDPRPALLREVTFVPDATIVDEPDFEFPELNQPSELEDPDEYSIPLSEPRPSRKELHNRAHSRSTSELTKRSPRVKPKRVRSAKQRASTRKSASRKRSKSGIAVSKRTSSPKFKVTFSVQPSLKKTSSYNPGTRVTFKSKVYEGSKLRKGLPVYYEASSDRKRYRKVKRASLKLQSTRYVRACVKGTKQCSPPKRLYVLDSHTADTLLSD